MIQDVQRSMPDDELVREKVKQIALNHFYDYYVRRDMENAFKYVSENVQWVGSKEHYVAHNRNEWCNLLTKELDNVPYDCMIKVIMADVVNIGMDCYNVSGELELRLPYQTTVYYSTLRFTLMLMEKDGSYRIVSIHTSTTGDTVLMDEKEVEELSMKQMATDLKHQSRFDSVTGLLHLDIFKRQMKQKLQDSDGQKRYALICTDISNFEKMNNLYGLRKADHMLAELATMLTTCSKNVELCCRSVADHFLGLIAYTERERLCHLLHVLCVEFDRKISVQYAVASTRLGIGVFLIENVEITIEKMVDYANMARKSLRLQKKTPIAFYDANLYANIEKVNRIEERMQEALDNREFRAFLQPKYNLETGRIVGAEALVRWIRSDGSMVYPDEFIPVFESNGFITKLDFFILGEVCQMLKRRLNEGRFCVPVSINQSRVLLQDDNYVKKVAAVLAQYNTPPRYIELELTERIFRDDLKEIATMMGKLKALGVRWSIDDFGTGYSSLNLLKELPVDIIKIDKSFLDETESSETSKIIIRKTVELTQELDMAVICEGVETENQADYLRGIRCDMAQGYLYAKPMPMEQFEQLLDKEMC